VLQLRQRVVQRLSRLALRPKTALTNLLATAVLAADVEHEAASAPRLLTLPIRLTSASSAMEIERMPSPSQQQSVRRTEHKRLGHRLVTAVANSSGKRRTPTDDKHALTSHNPLHHA